MKATRRMTVRRFERIHPTLRVELSELPRHVGFWRAAALLRSDGSVYAQAVHRDPLRALYELSTRCLRLAIREAADKQGWRDSNTGELVPLGGHHIVRRSKARNDSPENLAAVGAETHQRQHERRGSR